MGGTTSCNTKCYYIDECHLYHLHNGLIRTEGIRDVEVWLVTFKRYCETQVDTFEISCLKFGYTAYELPAISQHTLQRRRTLDTEK